MTQGPEVSEYILKLSFESLLTAILPSTLSLLTIEKTINLAFKNLKDSKVFTGNPQTDLKLKIIMGDSSDNIPSVFPKCGIKTARKCVDDPEYFKKKMDDNISYYEQYLLNDTLVSFDKIPVELIDEFMYTNSVLLETLV
jgi:5'-3' exonuclease